MSNIVSSTIYAVFFAFFISLLSGPLMIPMLKKLKFGQNIREEGPKSHFKKSGTPTMGGIIFLIGILISALIWSKFNSTFLMLIFITFGFGFIGFMDDYIKIVKKRSLGLTPSQKILGQFLVSAVFVFFVVNKMNIGSDLYIPFLKKSIDFGWLYIPIIIFIIIGVANSVNLTDGIDGLASSVTVVVMIFFAVITVAASNGAFSDYNGLIKNATHVDFANIGIFTGAICGGLFGFLFYNSNPAKVFMGDTGSLALGGAVVGISVLLKWPVILMIVGFIYMLESLSVMIQVTSFKFTGKRVFKMAPIHHHFEFCGWSETKIVTVFSIVTAVLCMLGLLLI
jgi:phospho-N-acetylmuramoyl-pentapeptide-transferase